MEEEDENVWSIANRVIKALESLIYSPYELWKRRVDWLKAHEEQRFFEPYTFDLGEVRTSEEHPILGDVIIVDYLDGEATIVLNNEGNLPLTLYNGRKIYHDFFRFFVTNTVQAGKTLKIIVGQEGAFDLTDTDYWINLVYDAVGAVQSGTDKIIDGMASDDKLNEVIAKLDDVQTELDDINTKTGLNVGVQPSDNVLHSNDTETSTTQVAYAKRKEFQCLTYVYFRVKFKLACTIAAQPSYGRIYKNGVALGTENHTHLIRPIYEEFIEDFPFEPNDLIQLYTCNPDGSYAWIKDFRLCGTESNSTAVVTLE